MTADEMAELMATGSVRSRPIPIGVLAGQDIIAIDGRRLSEAEIAPWRGTSLGKPAVDTSTEVGREEGTEAVGSISKR